MDVTGVEEMGGGMPVPGVEGEVAGSLITWPIWRVVGFMPGFAATRAGTERLNLAAMDVKVSPDLMVYVFATGGLGCGGGTGTGG